MTPTTKRIDVVMPAKTLRAIDKMTRPGQRSDLINRAIEHYVATQSTDAIRKRLEMTAVRDLDTDRQTGQT